MKKALKIFTLILTFAIVLTGCTTTKSYTFKVETGDKIKVELKTNDKYDIDSNVPFTITKDGETVTQGTFAVSSAYDQYLASVESDSNAELIKKDSTENLEYIFYKYNSSNHTEYNYIIKIVGSNTNVILTNTISEESAKECFERLTFTEE